MIAITYDRINDIFVSKFPELATLFEEQYNLWNNSEIPPHCFLGDVLNDYIAELLRNRKDKEQIKKVFHFYEEMACSNDWRVKNLLQVTLLECLWDEREIFEIALSYMLPQTRMLNEEIYAYLNVPK